MKTSNMLSEHTSINSPEDVLDETGEVKTGTALASEAQRLIASPMPQALKKFLAKTGLSETALDEMGIDKDDLLKLLRGNLSQWLRIASFDNFLSKSLMLPWLGKAGLKLDHPAPHGFISLLTCPATRVWPRSKSLLFEARLTITQAYINTEFSKGVQFASDTLWQALLASLVSNEIYIYSSCPQLYSREQLWLLLAGQPLSAASVGAWLTNPYAMAIVLGIPLAWGAGKALIASFDAKPLHKEAVHHLVERLKAYQPYPVKDIVYGLWPFSASNRAIKQMERALLWDGRLTAEERLRMLEALRYRARHGNKFLQGQAMAALMEVAGGISLSDFARLKKAGYDEPALRAALAVKLKAYKELRLLASHYRLPHRPQANILSPIVRYSYANYLLWYLGEPSNRLLSPLFWLLEGLKGAARLTVIAAIARALVELGQFKLQEWECHQKGKVWRYIDEIADFNCTVCADLPLYYKNTFTDNDCYEAYLKTSKNTSDIIQVINRLTLQELESDVFDWGPYFRLPDRADILKVLIEKNPSLIIKKITFSYPFREFPPPKYLYSIAESLTKLRFNALSLEYGMTDINFNIFVKYLARTTIKELDFGRMDGKKEINYTDMLINNWPRQLEKLSLQIDVSIETESAIKALFDKPLKSLSLGIEYSESSRKDPRVIIDLLAKTLPYREYDELHFTLNIDAYHDLDWSIFFKNLRLSNLKKLSFRCYKGYYFKLNELQQFSNVLPFTKLKSILFDWCGLEDDAIAALASVLPDTMLSTLSLLLPEKKMSERTIALLSKGLKHLVELDLWGNGIGDQGVAILAEGLQTANSLKRLDLSSNNIGDEGMIALANFISFTPVETLNLQRNKYGKIGATALAQCLNKTAVTDLSLRSPYPASCKIGAEGAEALSKGLPGSKIQRLDLSAQGIGDAGISALAQALPQSRVSLLQLPSNSITNAGIFNLTQVLKTQPVCHHSLWTQAIRYDYQKSRARYFLPTTSLTYLDLGLNRIETEGAISLCQVLPETYIPIDNLGLYANYNINTSKIDLATCRILDHSQPSSASQLTLPWPYKLLSQLYYFLTEQSATLTQSTAHTVSDTPDEIEDMQEVNVTQYMQSITALSDSTQGFFRHKHVQPLPAVRPKVDSWKREQTAILGLSTLTLGFFAMGLCVKDVADKLAHMTDPAPCYLEPENVSRALQAFTQQLEHLKAAQQELAEQADRIDNEDAALWLEGLDDALVFQEEVLAKIAYKQKASQAQLETIQQGLVSLAEELQETEALLTDDSVKAKL